MVQRENHSLSLKLLQYILLCFALGALHTFYKKWVPMRLKSPPTQKFVQKLCFSYIASSHPKYSTHISLE